MGKSDSGGLMAPFTPAEIASLLEYQRGAFFRSRATGKSISYVPYTRNGIILIPTAEGLRESEAGPVVQKWVHTFTADFGFRGITPAPVVAPVIPDDEIAESDPAPDLSEDV